MITFWSFCQNNYKLFKNKEMISLILFSTFIGKFCKFYWINGTKKYCIPGIIQCYPTHARIGNYSQYIPDYNLCGLSRNSLQTESLCSEYNQGSFQIWKMLDQHYHLNHRGRFQLNQRKTPWISALIAVVFSLANIGYWPLVTV